MHTYKATVKAETKAISNTFLFVYNAEVESTVGLVACYYRATSNTLARKASICLIVATIEIQL